MPQIAESKGEYRGSHVREDAELAAWLAKRPTETPIEPDLPIIDPHHHFWHSPGRGEYLLPGILNDMAGGHNIVSTVFLECRAMYRKEGPRHMAALGEVEFVAGLAAMSASGGFGPCRVAEVIIGGGDLTLGAANVRADGSRDRGGRRTASRHAPRRGNRCASFGWWFRVPPGTVASGHGPEIPRRLCPTRTFGPKLRVLAVSPATARRDRSRAFLPEHLDHFEPRRRHTRRWAVS